MVRLIGRYSTHIKQVLESNPSLPLGRYIYVGLDGWLRLNWKGPGELNGAHGNGGLGTVEKLEELLRTANPKGFLVQDPEFIAYLEATGEFDQKRILYARDNRAYHVLPPLL